MSKSSMTEVLEIETDKIESNPYQPRHVFDETKIRDLASSIEKVGLLNPILVRKKGEGYQLVHGERRFRAFKLLQKRTIPAVVREVSDKELAVFSLIENMQREDLNPIDEALCYKRMIDELAFTHEEIADTINKDRTYITNRLRLLGLPEDIQEKVRRLTLTPGHAEALLKYQRLMNDAKDMPLYPHVLPEMIVKKPETRLKAVAAKIEKGDISVKELRVEIASFERNVTRLAENSREFDKASVDLKERGLEQYIPALHKGEISYQNGSLILTTTLKEFTGQETRFPKYSGQQEVFPIEQEKTLNYPLFSEEEWRELSDYTSNHDEILRKMFLGFSPIYDRAEVKESVLNRRTYDPSYGDFFYDLDSGKPAYAKKGFGRWVVIEFNDGEGNRTSRRFFRQDFLSFSLVEQAIQTAHPDMFSDFNYRKLQIHSLQEYEMSWFYFRKKTATRKDAIEALKKDLELLESQKPLTNEEIMEKAKTVLNEVFEKTAESICLNHPDGFREGEITFKQEVE